MLSANKMFIRVLVAEDSGDPVVVIELAILQHCVGWRELATLDDGYSQQYWRRAMNTEATAGCIDLLGTSATTQMYWENHYIKAGRRC